MSDDEEREERTKQYLLDEARRAIALRTKDREFHGLEREFLYLQARMLVDYDETKDCRDANGHALAYVYFEEYAAQAAKLLTPKSAHRLGRQHLGGTPNSTVVWPRRDSPRRRHTL
jgi:hypothetical protein